jgi:PAS domain-containing protein
MKPTPSSTIRRLQRALTALTTLAPPETLARERAETLLAHLTHVPIAILIANNQARYVDVNRAAARLTGYTRAELEVIRSRRQLGYAVLCLPFFVLLSLFWEEQIGCGRCGKLSAVFQVTCGRVLCVHRDVSVHALFGSAKSFTPSVEPLKSPVMRREPEIG